MSAASPAAGPTRFTTFTKVDDERTKRGRREIERDSHHELCDGFDCPCYKEGQAMLALRHLDILDHFAKVDPELVRERLDLYHGTDDA